VDAAGILALYDRTMRRHPTPLPPGYRLVREGGLTAIVDPSPADHDNTVIYAEPDPAAVGAAIASAVACFAGLGHGFEWKLYRHDDPTGALAAGLVASGLVAGETETLMALDLGDTEIAPASAADVRRLETPAPLADIVAVQDEVWGGDHRDLIESLAAEWSALPGRIS